MGDSDLYNHLRGAFPQSSYDFHAYAGGDFYVHFSFDEDDDPEDPLCILIYDVATSTYQSDRVLELIPELYDKTLWYKWQVVPRIAITNGELALRTYYNVKTLLK